jgi:hypothetical protein
VAPQSHADSQQGWLYSLLDDHERGAMLPTLGTRGRRRTDDSS